MHFAPFSFMGNNTWGTLDTVFSSNVGNKFNSTVSATALQGDGKIVVGGSFTNYDGETGRNLIRLNQD